MRRFVPLVCCLSLLVLGLFAAGAASAQTPTPTSTSTPTLSPTLTATATEPAEPTATPAPTETPEVTATVPPTSTPVVTATVVPTSTKMLTRTHPVALAIASFFQVPVSETIALRSVPGMGFGNIARVYFLATATGTSISEIVALRESGLGWGQVAAELLVHPSSKGRNLGVIMRSRAEQPPAGDTTESGQAPSTLGQSSSNSAATQPSSQAPETPPGEPRDGSVAAPGQARKPPESPPGQAKEAPAAPPGRAKHGTRAAPGPGNQGSGTPPSQSDQRPDHGASSNRAGKGKGKP